MKNRDLFTLNPKDVNLKNEGVAKIRTINETDDLEIAEYELKTFVCEGEYHDGLKKILQFYLQNIESSQQPAFWVSGFYGSGKSHLVKMAGYLWSDVELPGGKTARTIKQLPDDINDLLQELSLKQKIHGKLSIAGTLRDFPSKDIRYSFLQLLLNTLGLPTQLHHFQFVYWLKQEGVYDQVKALLEVAGKSFKAEVGNLFVSSALAKAVLECLPEAAENEIKLKELFKAQFVRKEDIGREAFVDTISNQILPLFFGTKIPCTLIVLDEVQQFIGKDPDLADNVQFLAEDLSSRFNGKFLLVGTGQSALTDTPILQKLMARFRIPVQLSNTDIQTVIRKTILEKKPTTISVIESKLESVSGEIARNLEGTKYSYTSEDKKTLVADYPLLPSTRKLWNDTLKVIDVAGTSGQLRNQLRTIDDSLKQIADNDLGSVIPADYIFDLNQTQLIQAGLLLNDTANLIQERKSKGGDALLEGRILSVVFLLEKITSDIQNTGLKANESTIAEMLMENLNENSEGFRNKVKSLIKKLAEDKVLMTVNDEYRLQTKVGSEWEQEFSKNYIKLNNSSEDIIQQHRRERIIAYFKDKTKSISINQGYSKINREFDLWDKDTMPNTEQKLNLWIRDGWYENEGTVMNEIRAAGNNAPLAYVFVKKLRDMDLRTQLINFLAARATIDLKGIPSDPEGMQAKKSMETRQQQAKNAIQELIEKICSESTVYLAGGNQVQTGGLRENIDEALRNIADRQFSEFKSKADAIGWDKVLTKALAGQPDALQIINYSGDIDKHPVATSLLHFIGNSQKPGKDIRNFFMKAPYGWSQDAIDAMLVLLKLTQHISTPETDLKVAKINQALFKKETIVIGAKDKIAIRKLMQDAGISCPPNQEIFAYSNDYLAKLKTLAANVSGDAPRPEPVNIQFIKEIENREGNDRLQEMLLQKEVLAAKYSEWSASEKLIIKREPSWKLVAQLEQFAPDTDDFCDLKKEIGAIRDNRLLLQEPDPVQPILNRMCEKLSQLLDAKKQNYIAQFDAKMQELQENEYFNKLLPDQKHSILVTHQILEKPKIKALDAVALLNHLQKLSFYGWDTRIAALQGQFNAALEDAIRLSAPQAKSYSLPRRTISNQADIDAYVAALKAELEILLQKASSIILK